jgi:hypothetical protein
LKEPLCTAEVRAVFLFWGDWMGHLFLVVALLAVLAAVAAFLKKGQPGASKDVTYDARRELFSPAERSFLGVLEQALEERFRVMGKVRLGDLVQPAKGFSRSQRTGAWNRINQKHIDFVLCQPDTLAVAGVVELDDASHRRKDRSARDDFIDKALASAGIPIVHFAARRAYAAQEIKDGLAGMLLAEQAPAVSSGLAVGPKKEQVPVAASEESASGEGNTPEERALENKPTSADAARVKEPKKEKAPVCPACNSPMVKRMAKKGPHAGKRFWACSAYPKCRKILAIDEMSRNGEMG